MVRDMVTTALGLAWTALLALVGARFFSLLIGADSTSKFVDTLYRRSDFWVRPVVEQLGLANKALLTANGGSFELASLVAFGLYLVGGWLLLSIVRDGVFGGSDSSYAY